MKPRILISTDFYLPGYKSGGAVRTIVSMIERMRNEFDFTVVTRNHDGWGDFEPYHGVKTGEWNLIDNIPVFYFGKDGIGSSKLNKIWLEANPDACFMVSFFSSLTTQTLILRRLGRLPATPLIVAPQGELSKGSLKIKARKKNIFLKFVKNFGIYRNLVWKASNDEEKLEIERVLGRRENIEIVPDLTPRVILPDYQFAQKPAKKNGELRLVFLSRINRKKNLSFALKALETVQHSVIFDVYGAHDDADYWRECQGLIEKLPPNVKIAVYGSIDYRAVAETMSRYHFFILPTLAENFGHVVLEAMAAGCPVLLSERTPWRELAKKNVGWDLDLADLDLWRRVLNQCALMSPNEFAAKSAAARRFALAQLTAPEVERLNRELLRKVLKTAN